MNLDCLRDSGLRMTAAVVMAITILVTACSSDDAIDGETATTQTAVSTTTTPQPSSSVEVATQFWEALADGDRDATLGLVDPAVIESPDLSPFGRAQTLNGQFDWYESVGWDWKLAECGEADDGAIECMASASNLWSDALGVDPVSGTFVVEVEDDGVTAVTDQAELFRSQWGSMVFRVFAEWVDTNHPADAATMFDFAVDINDEILGLYEVNSSRFVEAQSSG